MPLHKQDKDTKALAAELAALPVVSSLDHKAIEAISSTGRVVHLPSGWALMSENTPADSVYLLLDGSTEVRHGSEVIATLSGGTFVGEAALIDRRRRNATVITASPVRALRLNYDDMAALFGKHPSVEDLFRSEWEKKTAASASA